MANLGHQGNQHHAFYAKSFLRYNLDGSCKNYRRFITHNLRGVKRAPPSPGLLLADNLVNLDLKVDGTRIRLKMNSSDYYIHGFTVGFQNDNLWEMRRAGDAVKLDGSHALGFRVNYPQGADSICRRTIGYDALRNAVQNLIRSPHPNQDPTLKRDILIILIMFIEAARFQWIFDTCNTYLTKGKSALIAAWIEILVKNWSVLCGIAAQCHVEPLILRSEERAYVDDRQTSVLFDEKNPELAARIAKDLVKAYKANRETGLYSVKFSTTDQKKKKKKLLFDIPVSCISSLPFFSDIRAVFLLIHVSLM